MKVCFFGHSDAPWSIQPKLREVILDLIDNEGADEFYVGNHGNFDRMAIAVLSELSETRAFRFYVCLRIHRQKKKNPAPITQSSPMKLNISLLNLPSTTETNSWSKRLTSWSPTSNIRGEELPSSSYWQKRKTGKLSKSVPKTQLTLRFFNCFNFIIHFSTCIIS